MGKQWKQWQTLFLVPKITTDGDWSHEIKRHLLLGRKGMTNLDSIVKSRDITNKVPSSQSYGFPSSHVWIWELNYKDIWAPNFLNSGAKEILESPLDCKEIQPVHHTGNQSWLFIGRTDAELKLQYLATYWEVPTHLKRPWCWERLKAGGEGDDRGWYGWMASSTWWSRVWVGSRIWWWTGKLEVLQSMGLQRAAHKWATELNWYWPWCGDISLQLWFAFL